MFYSCFNPQIGLYDYFEDSSTRPINGDLPIPKLPASTGRIGVPSIEAGRPLPSAAKRVGRGWHARGMIVKCNRGLGGLASSDSGVGTGTALLIAGALTILLIAGGGWIGEWGRKRGYDW